MTTKRKIIGASIELISEITKKVSPREQAIFTIIRQTGLSPEVMKKLKYKDLEETKQLPRKIEVRQFPERRNKPPVFIGEEANLYLNRYLAKRSNIAPEDPLFCSRTGKEINTKNLSRTFRRTLDKLMKEKKSSRNLVSITPQPTHRREYSIYSLVRYYQENAKSYEKALKDNPNENDDFYRNIYEKKAMPSLEIETLITINLTRKQRKNEIANQSHQIKEMKQTIAADREYISSILTLLYNNNGDIETGENIEIGDNFLKLWKETFDKQLDYLPFAWTNIGKFKLLPMEDIIEEFTKTLLRIKKPYDELEQQIGKNLSEAKNDE